MSGSRLRQRPDARSDAAERFRWLFEYAPRDRRDFDLWLDKAQANEDPLFFTI